MLDGSEQGDEPLPPPPYREITSAEEQALLELSARLPQPLPQTPSASSSGSTDSHQRPHDASPTSEPPSPARRPVRRPGRRLQQSGSASELAGTRKEASERQASVSLRATAAPKPFVSSAPAQAIRDAERSSASNSSPSSLEAFVRDFRSALSLLLTQGFLPLAFSLYTSFFGLLGIPSDDGRCERQPLRRLPSARTRAAGQSFAERFKFVVCTSFLLTSSLSISFYESDPVAPQPSPKLGPSDADDEEVNDEHYAPLTRLAPHPLRLSISAVASDAPVHSLPGGGASASGPTSADASLLPRLNEAGKRVRDGTLAAVCLLAFASSTWDRWFRSCLALVSLSWAGIIALNLAELDDLLLFDVSHIPAAPGHRFLFESRGDDRLTLHERRALERDAIQRVKRLVKSAQAYDVAVNKCIGAVQEVELVSRGYKLTHPLPPISRIEAATGSTAWASGGGTPTRNRHSTLVLGGGASQAQGARLSRSSSAGASAASNRRHAQRTLSLSLSTGRASPAQSFESHDDGDNGRRTQSFGAPPRRLAPLRQAVLQSLDRVTVRCKERILELETLADKDELALLKEMYSLDAPAPGCGSGSESDVPELVSHEDASISSFGLTVDSDRNAWVTTTPRNVGSKRQSTDLTRASSLRSDEGASSRGVTSPLGRKRLSLLSDGQSATMAPYDRAGASSSASKRDSLVSEGVSNTYRSPRLNYVTDTSVNPGPNDSAASKRLSYMSVSSAAASAGPRSPLSNAGIGGSSPFRPASPFGAFGSPVSRGDAKAFRPGILGANGVLNLAGAHEEALDPQTLLGLKSRFERMHLARRATLCHLLALDFSLEVSVKRSDGAPSHVEAYWERCSQLLADLGGLFDAELHGITSALGEEMGNSFGLALKRSDSGGQSASGAETSGSALVGKARSGSCNLYGHLGLEDRFSAMALALRSVQAKLRVCAEEVRVKRPAELHGLESEVPVAANGAAARSAAASSDEDALAHVERVQQMFETIKDDLLALSAEWEAGNKIFKKEKRLAPVAAALDGDDDVARGNAARDLESPMEADEDAAQAVETDALGTGEGAIYESRGALVGGGTGGADHNDDDDDDIAALLLRSTSPQHLPPPGLEQVFESIAGIANIAGIGGPKLSREERIRQVKQRREEEVEAKARKASHRHTIDPAGIVSELSDVIRTRKANVERSAAETRQQHGRGSLDANRYRHSIQSQQRSIDGYRTIGDGLGSPVNLGGSASAVGVFESSAVDVGGDVGNGGGEWMPSADADLPPPTTSSRRASRYNVANERRSSVLYRHLQSRADSVADPFPSDGRSGPIGSGSDNSFHSASTPLARGSLDASTPLSAIYERNSVSPVGSFRTPNRRSPAAATAPTTPAPPAARTREASYGSGQHHSDAASSVSNTEAFALDLDFGKQVAEFAARKRREAAAAQEEANVFEA
ncbi:hypothetical protein ACQY0O_003832 [Thecaphora frezii]